MMARHWHQEQRQQRQRDISCHACAAHLQDVQDAGGVHHQQPRHPRPQPLAVLVHQPPVEPCGRQPAVSTSGCTLRRPIVYSVCTGPDE
jgi:hypothetical protein